jgi:hypothetical protein
MAETKLGVTKPRNTQLKAVDDALLEYGKARNEKNLWKLKNAFEDWKRQEGINWEKSERNRTRIITKLNQELSKAPLDYRTYQVTHFSFEELRSLQYVATERKKVLANLFKDKTVTFKLAKVKEHIVTAGRKVEDTSKQAGTYIKSKVKGIPVKSGRPTSDIIKEKMGHMVKSFFGVGGLEDLGLLAEFIIKIVEKCSVTVAPVVGIIKDGYDVFVDWAKVGATLYEEYGIHNREYAIDTGAPSAAFGGLVKCLQEEEKKEAVSAARATSAFALKTGLLFADGGAISGPVVGVANALAEISHQLYLLATEWRATQAVNRALTAGELDIRLFKTYPLMGCYLLVCGTLSDLIPIESFGTPGWMDYIENMKKHAFDEIYLSATKLIDSSPWEIIGMPKRPKGTTGGIFSDVKKIWSTTGPLTDLRELGSLGKK